MHAPIICMKQATFSDVGRGNFLEAVQGSMHMLVGQIFGLGNSSKTRFRVLKPKGVLSGSYYGNGHGPAACAIQHWQLLMKITTFHAFPS